MVKWLETAPKTTDHQEFHPQRSYGPTPKGMKPIFSIVLAVTLLCCVSACMYPSPKRYQHILHGFSVERIDSVGQSLLLRQAPKRSYQLNINADKYLHTTTCNHFNQDSIVIEYWYWDPFGQLITYRKFDNRGRRKLEIQVDNPNLANEYRLAKIPAGESFRTEHFRHDQPWRAMHFHDGKTSHISKSGKYQISFHPNGRRQIKLDAMPDDKVRRARLWDETGKCIADTTFAIPQSVTRLRPNPLKFLQNISH